MSYIKPKIFQHTEKCKCVKCEGEMQDRKMFTNTMDSYVKIKQCYICRFWFRDLD